MIVQAKTHTNGACFVIGTAEALPLGSGSVGLITAAGVLNFTNASGFFAEAKRVLSIDGVLVVYDFATGCQSAACPDLASWSGGFAVSLDGGQLAVADQKGGIHVLSVAKGRQLGAAINGSGAPVALSSTGLVAAPVHGGSMALFQISPPHRRVANLIGSGRYGTPTAAAFSPDGTLLAVSFLTSGQTLTNRIAFWNATTYQAVGHPLLTSGPIFQLAFSPDDSLLGTSSNSGKVQLWSVANQRQVAVLADDKFRRRSWHRLQPEWLHRGGYGRLLTRALGSSL